VFVTLIKITYLLTLVLWGDK